MGGGQKSVFRSRMFWVNALQLALALYSERAAAWVSAHPAGYMAALGLLNVFLRCKTKHSLYLY